MGSDMLRARVLPAAVALLLASGLLHGQSSAPVSAAASKQANEMAGQLMSPYCPGLTLLACPSTAAATLREEMAGRLDSGETPDAVRANLVERFGSQVTGVPEKDGIGALAWIVPPVAAAGMLGAVYLLGRRRTKQDEAAADTVAPERQAQIDDELDRLDP